MVGMFNFSSLFKNLYFSIKYQLLDKWKFIYFEIDIRDYKSMSLINNGKQMNFRKADVSDIKNFKNNIYPYLKGYGNNDKKYLENPEANDVFICEKNNKIIHYFLFFSDAKKSPIISTPINNNLLDNYAYLGSAFTVPSERGTWIMAYSISYILKYLKEKTEIKKILLIIHPSTPGAKQFFERVGFNVMNDCAPNGLFIWLINKVNFFAK